MTIAREQRKVRQTKGRALKINIEIECTPEEARSFMGLPDVTQANSIYMDAMTNAMRGASNPDQLREYAEALAPMGQMGLQMFQSFVEAGMRGTGRARSDDEGAG